MEPYNDYVQALYKESKDKKRSSGYKTTRLRSQRLSQEKSNQPRDDFTMENNVAQMASGIKHLETLYGSLDRKMYNPKSDLESKFEHFASEHKKRMEFLEGAHTDFETRLANYQKTIDEQEKKIETLKEELQKTDIDNLRGVVSSLQEKITDIMEKVDRQDNSPKSADLEDIRQIIVALAKKSDYHDSKLNKHDRQFLEVYTDLKDKYMAIDGLQEGKNEFLMGKVIDDINSTLQAGSNNPICISHDDIDLVYRTGKFNIHNKYPRTVIVIFVRKGLKQHIVSVKRRMIWDMSSKISYSDELTHDVRKHRDILKAVLEKAQHSEFVTKLAGNRIIVDGVSYGSDELDLLPYDLKKAIPQMKRIERGIVFKGKECYLSNFFPVEIKIDDDSYCSVEQYFQYSKCNACGDYDRAEKILATDDPLHAKALGDGCPNKIEWLEIRVFTMFKALFHKFVQHQSLTAKLLATEGDGLYEATTDKFFGCGIGFHSKKWENKSWEGKNVTGTLLTQIRRILKKKSEEGLQLDRLVFNFSLPALRRSSNSKLKELFFGDLSNDDIPEKIDKKEHASSLVSACKSLEAGKDRADREIGELSALIERLENESRHTEDSIIRSWAARRQSHSLVNPTSSSSLKHRENPPRAEGSLTIRERKFIHHTEEIDFEENACKQAGFDRSYGHNWQNKPSASSTPMKANANSTVADQPQHRVAGPKHEVSKQGKKDTPPEDPESTSLKTLV